MKDNILILFVDQLRFDAISAYGNKDVITPNLQSLSEDGNINENHYCTFPVCTPSRYSFLSGCYTNEHHGITNHSTLSPSIQTFPRKLKEEGYHTVAVGKMHATPTYLDMGFEKMILSEQDGKGRMEDDYHKYLYDNNEVDTIDVIDQREEYRKLANQDYFDSFGTQVSNLSEQHHSTSYIARNAIKEIDNWSDEKELLMVSFIKPHHPFDPNQRFVDMYDDKKIKLLPGFTEEIIDRDYDFQQGYFDYKTMTEESCKKMTKYYYASITQIDYNIGLIISKLKEKDLYDSTEIIFTSDHGDYLGYHHMALKGNYMYEPLMHIPLIIKKPNNKKIKFAPISDNTQIAATILNERNIELAHSMNDEDLTDERKYILAEDRRYFNEKYENYYMVKNNNFKILVNGSFNKIYAFDLKKDPNEFTDVSKKVEYSSIINDMKSYLINEILFSPRSNSLEEESATTVSKSKNEVLLQNKIITKYYKEKLL